MTRTCPCGQTFVPQAGENHVRGSGWKRWKAARDEAKERVA